MPNIPIKTLRHMGVSEVDISLAKVTQSAQRRNGSKVQSIGVIVGAAQERKTAPPTDLTEVALRKRGTYDQAALLLDQQALQEASPERAAQAREAAKIAKDLSATANLEFDFFGGGNVSIAHEYHDAVTERLRTSGRPVSEIMRAKGTLWDITRHLGWQSYECTKTAADLCDLSGIHKVEMSKTLALLEEVGAIRRVKKGRSKVITVTPEGAFRGNINNHAKVVERYKLNVIDGGKVEA